MFRRHRFGGLLGPLVVGALLLGFARHAHRRVHMMMHFAEAQAGDNKPFDKPRFHSHWHGDPGPYWQHFRYAHHWRDAAEPERADEEASPDVGDGKASG